MAKTKPSRHTLFDSLSSPAVKNLFCARSVLTNEAAVEMFFVNPMLKHLGYKDSQIKPKTSIEELTVSAGGSKKVQYKPDYVLTFKKKPRIVIDAKDPTEVLDKWVFQCSGYCLNLNQRFQGENPVQRFILTNGAETRIYDWDNETPLLTIAFADFDTGNPQYEQFRALVSADAVVEAMPVNTHSFKLERPTSAQARSLFTQCNKIIRNAGQAVIGAFWEFTKLMFVKLWCDRQLRQVEAVKAILEKPGGAAMLPQDAITFSVHWIEQQKFTDSPINDILFKKLRDEIELEISRKKKKRIFESNERINLKPETIKAVVRKLEGWDLYGIDEDLNGRLFETFLNAIMRGKPLGQYFTPRSVVKLMTKMANVKIGRPVIDKVVDACCGSGGFLIEILTEMRNAIRSNDSLGDSDREERVRSRSCA